MPRIPRASDIGGSQISSPANAPQINTGVAASIGAAGKAWQSAIGALGDAFGSIAAKAGDANDHNEIYKIKLDWMEKSQSTYNDIEQNVDATGDKWQEMRPRFQGLRDEFQPRLDRITDPKKRAALEFDMSKEVVRYGQNGLENYRRAKVNVFDQELSSNLDRAASELSTNPDNVKFEEYQNTLIGMAEAGRDKYIPQAKIDERVRQIRGALTMSMLKGLAMKGEDTSALQKQLGEAGYEIEQSGGDDRLRDKSGPAASGKVIDRSNSGLRTMGGIKPQGIVFHHTAGGSSEGAINALKQRGLSYNYLIEKDGTVVQLVPPEQGALHMRPSEKGGLTNGNSVGISFVARNDGDVTAAQRQAGRQLAGQIAQKYGIDQKNVFGHGEVNSHKEHDEGAQDARHIRENGFSAMASSDASAPAPPAQPEKTGLAGRTLTQYAGIKSANDTGPQVEIKDPVRTARQSFAALYPGTDPNTVISNDGQVDLAKMSGEERARVIKLLGKDGVDVPHKIDGDKIMLDRQQIAEAAKSPQVQGYVAELRDAAASDPNAPLTGAVPLETLELIAKQRPDIGEKITQMTVGQALGELEKAGVSGLSKRPSDSMIPQGRMLSGQTFEFTTKTGQTFRFRSEDFNAIDPKLRQQFDRDLKEIVTLRRKNELSLVNGMIEKQLSAIENTGKDHSEFDMGRVRNALAAAANPEALRKFESRLELSKQVNRVINDAGNVPDDVLEQRLADLNEHIGDTEASPEAVKARSKAEAFVKKLRDVRQKDPAYAVRDADLVRDALSRVPGGIPKTPTDVYNVADAILRKQKQLGLEPTPITKAQAKAIIDPIAHATSPAQKKELALATVGKLQTDFKEHAQLALDSAMRLASSDKTEDRDLLSMKRWRSNIDGQTNAAIDRLAKGWRPLSPWDEQAPAGGWDSPPSPSPAAKRLKPNRFDAIDAEDNFFKLKK